MEQTATTTTAFHNSQLGDRNQWAARANPTTPSPTPGAVSSRSHLLSIAPLQPALAATRLTPYIAPSPLPLHHHPSLPTGRHSGTHYASERRSEVVSFLRGRHGHYSYLTTAWSRSRELPSLPPVGQHSSATYDGPFFARALSCPLCAGEWCCSALLRPDYTPQNPLEPPWA